jgi:hypothetical protein
MIHGPRSLLASSLTLLALVPVPVFNAHGAVEQPDMLFK